VGGGGGELPSIFFKVTSNFPQPHSDKEDFLNSTAVSLHVPKKLNLRCSYQMSIEVRSRKITVFLWGREITRGQLRGHALRDGGSPFFGVAQANGSGLVLYPNPILWGRGKHRWGRSGPAVSAQLSEWNRGLGGGLWGAFAWGSRWGMVKKKKKFPLHNEERKVGGGTGVPLSRGSENKLLYGRGAHISFCPQAQSGNLSAVETTKKKLACLLGTGRLMNQSLKTQRTGKKQRSPTAGKRSMQICAGGGETLETWREGYEAGNGVEFGGPCKPEV